MLLALTAVVAVNRFELNIASTDVLYFGSGTTGVARAESFILLPLIFTFVAAAFIPLGAPARPALQTNRTAHRLHLRHSRQPGWNGDVFPDQLLLVRPGLLVRDPGRARPSAQHPIHFRPLSCVHSAQRRDRLVPATRHLLVALLQNHPDAGAAELATNSTSTASGIRA